MCAWKWVLLHFCNANENFGKFLRILGNKKVLVKRQGLCNTSSYIFGCSEEMFLIHRIRCLIFEAILAVLTENEYYDVFMLLFNLCYIDNKYEMNVWNFSSETLFPCSFDIPETLHALNLPCRFEFDTGAPTVSERMKLDVIH